MRVISGYPAVKGISKSVVALGVFDGLHRAHRKILCAALRNARRKKVSAIVVTFWPHPRKEKSIYSLSHRFKLLERIGFDYCLAIHFTLAFSRISARKFVEKILIKKLRAQAVYIGKNFHFGNKARGDYRLLKDYARQGNFTVRAFDVMNYKNQAISSSSIRGLIIRGELGPAAKLLGRPVSILGTVIKGDKLGRKWNVPTANIDPHHEVVPPSGIYAVKALVGVKLYNGVCYIGSRPTLKDKGLHIEVHLFDFSGNIYGKDIEVQFLRKIRPDKRFASIQELVAQINRDIVTAKKILYSRNLPPQDMPTNTPQVH